MIKISIEQFFSNTKMLTLGVFIGGVFMNLDLLNSHVFVPKK